MTPERATPIRVEVKKDTVTKNGNPVTLKEETEIREKVRQEQKLYEKKS